MDGMKMLFYAILAIGFITCGLTLLAENPSTGPDPYKELLERQDQAEAWINQHLVLLQISNDSSLAGVQSFDLRIDHSAGLIAAYAKIGGDFEGWQVAHNFLPGQTRLSMTADLPDTLLAGTELMTLAFKQSGTYRPYNFKLIQARFNDGKLKTTLGSKVWLEYQPE